MLLITGKIDLKSQICDPMVSSQSIQDSQVTMVQILVEGVVPDDLSDDDQCLSAVSISFEHSQIGDLTIRLVSPSGQSVTLVGPNTNSNITTFSDWDVTFTACGNPSAPDPGFPSTWSNNAPWGILGNYVGVYYPQSGCLEDFNTGPVNGTWTLVIEDHLKFDQGKIHSVQLFFCNSESVDCSLCQANAGNFSADTLTYCRRSPQLYFNRLEDQLIGTAPVPDYDLIFVATLKDSVIKADTLLDMRLFEPDTFKVCAIHYFENDTLLLDSISEARFEADYLSLFSYPSPQYCADISDTCLYVIILPSPEWEDIVTGTIDCYNPVVTLSTEYSGQTLIQEWEYPNGDLFYGDTLFSDQPGEHFLRIWNSYSCFRDTSVIVMADLEGPNFILPDTFPLSCTNPFVNLPLIILEPFDSVHWLGPGTFSSDNPQPQTNLSGQYVVTIWGKNGCISRDSVLLIESDELTEFTISIEKMTCDHFPGSIQIDFSGAFSITWQNQQTGATTLGPVVNYTAADTFLVDIRDQSSNCRAERIVVGVVDTIPPIIDFSPVDTLTCYDTAVELSFENPSDYIFHLWQGDGIVSDDVIFNATNPGWYLLTVEGENGCRRTDSIEVLANLEYEFDDIIVYLDCREDSIRLGVPFVVADNFEWYKDGEYYSDERFPYISNGGKYELIVSTNTGCIDTVLADVIEDRQPPEIVLEVSGELDCVNSTATIQALVLSSIQSNSFWSGPGGFFSSNMLVETDDPGFYIFSAEGQNHCIFLDSIEVVGNTTAPEVNATGDSIFCNEPVRPLSIQASVSGEIANLSWQGPGGYVSGNLSGTVTQQGIYIITVEGTNGCISKDTAVVIIDTLLPEILFSPPDTINCYNNGVSVSVQSNQTLASILWTGPLNFQSVENTIFTDVPGSYSVTVTTPTGCYNQSSLYIPINKLHPYLSLSAPPLTCRDTFILLGHQTNVDLFSLEWSGPMNYTASGELPPAELPGWYYCLITDLRNGCTHFDSVQLKTDFTAPVVSTRDFNLPCSGEPVQIFASSIPAAVKYTWSGPANFNFVGPAPLVNQPGMYYVIVENPENGCKTFDSVFVSAEPVFPEFEIISGSINCKDTIAHTIFVANSDILSVDWSGPGGFASNAFAPELPIEGTYLVRITGKNGCIKDTTILVTIDTIPPEINILYDDFLSCDKNTSVLNASGSDTGSNIGYLWQTNQGLILSGNYSQYPVIMGPGWYYLTLTNVKNHCKTLDSVFVDVKQSSIQGMHMELIHPGCFGETNGRIIVQDVTGAQYPVRFAIGNHYFSPINYFDNLKAGTYTIRVKDAYGCIYDTTVVLDYGSDIILNLYADKNEIYPGETVKLTANITSTNSIVFTDWQPAGLFSGTGNWEQWVTPSETTVFSVQVEDSKGCSAESSITVYVKERPDIFIPNIFTPNGDNINDRFFVQGKTNIGTIAVMEIFDRWGNRVYYRENLLLNDYATAWDGNFNGLPVAQGVYTYHVIMRSANSKLTHFAGDITVIW